MTISRICFVSYHAAFDPSNGAARTMRDTMHLFARSGRATVSLTGPCVDRRDGSGRETTLSTLKSEGRAFMDLAPTLLETNDRGTRSLVYLPEARNTPEPEPAERIEFLAHVEKLLGESSPDIVLMYGGGKIARAIAAAAKSSGASVVFRIMNMRYARRDLFDAVDGVLTPAAFVSRTYARTLGIASVDIPCPLDWDRTIVRERAPRFLTYVAPTLEKGLPWAARIFEDLSERRPDIPLLAVEGRGSLVSLSRCLSREAGKHVLASATVPDPRSFLAETRLLLMPSYVEPSGRLAQEALLNGIPVIGSNRGGLPQTLAEGGIALPIDAAYSEGDPAMPPSVRVAAWIAAIEKLWDDTEAMKREVARCMIARERWRPERLAQEYLAYFARLRGDPAPELPVLRGDADAVPLPAKLDARALAELVS